VSKSVAVFFFRFSFFRHFKAQVEKKRPTETHARAHIENYCDNRHIHTANFKSWFVVTHTCHVLGVNVSICMYFFSSSFVG